ALDDLSHFHRLAVHVDRSIAGDRKPVDGKKHIARLKTSLRNSALVNISNKDPRITIREPQGFAHCRIVQRMVANGQIHITVVMSIFHILEKATDDWCWNHVTDILRHIAAVALKGDAYYLPILQHRSAAVARVDGRVDLDGQMGVHAGVRIRLEIDTRYHSPCHRKP